MSLEQFGALFGVHKSTALRWEENQVPAERVADIESQTGIPRHFLRPDLWSAPAEAAAS
jgi:DNA-binding transcriptional regulator YdaS (Cro superfamily)